MSLADKKYDKKIVIKPWGYEYVAFREKNDLGITFLRSGPREFPSRYIKLSGILNKCFLYTQLIHLLLK